jgi:hypothetical protein|tara:strand:- start:270 stop:467 length:198 start_codon:yes stop_codon:yes gene_type:complete
MGILDKQTFNTVLGLRDVQPLTAGGRDIASQTHAKGEGTNISIPSESSNLDLSGPPGKYTDNLPK